MATKVKLRQKLLKDGKRKSLYLDFYPPIPHPKTGKPTRREFLGKYILAKARNPLDKQHDSETLRVAEAIRQKRENEANKNEIYSEFELERIRLKEIGERNFTEYFKQLARKRKSSNYDNWVPALKHFEIFISEHDTFFDREVTFADLNEPFCNEFREYLLTATSNRSDKETLSQNTALSYYSKFQATLKQAYKDGLLQTDLNARIERIKEAETRREYLTLPEAKAERPAIALR